MTLVAWTSVDFILNKRLNPYHQRREEIYTATKQANGMSPNSVGLKDEYVFVKSTVLIKNPPYYNGDIVEKKRSSRFQNGNMAAISSAFWCWHAWFWLRISWLIGNIMFKCRLWMGLFFSIGKCVILVEHISTVVLDTKLLYYRKEADKCPQSMRSDNWQI